MKNWKTTIFGIAAAVPAFLAQYGVQVPFAEIITAIATSLAFVFAKDATTKDEPAKP